MAWKPVAEVAAAMGVSERTIWRRIKANTIESRNENGRTLVYIEEPDPETDPVRQLSHVAAAQLSMRKLDADTMTDVLAVLKDYRTSFDLEIARARREARWGLVTAVVLLVAVAAGVVYHTQKVKDLRDDRQTALELQQAELIAKHQEAIGGLKTRAAEAQAQAEALASEVETRRRTEVEHLTRLASAVSAQETLHSETQECLADLAGTITATDQRALAAAAEADALRAEIAALQTQLHQKSLAVEKHQRMAERVASALGRSAAMSNGEAAGLRIYINRLEEQLARLQGTSDSLEESPAESSRTPTREAILRSLLNEEEESPRASTGDPLWLFSVADDLLKAWLLPQRPLDDGKDLAQAAE
jgi:hypothetical protein